MATVTIDGNDYTVYADVDTADIYAAAATQAATWRAETDEDVKARNLVTATRLLDRQIWLDLYNTFALRVVVPDIVSASIELAFSLIDGSEVQNQQVTGERVRSLSAGSVSITNFRGIDPIQMRFPLIVQELLRAYLGSGVGLQAVATGVDGTSSFPIDLGYSGPVF